MWVAGQFHSDRDSPSEIAIVEGATGAGRCGGTTETTRPGSRLYDGCLTGCCILFWLRSILRCLVLVQSASLDGAKASLSFFVHSCWRRCGIPVALFALETYAVAVSEPVSERSLVTRTARRWLLSQSRCFRSITAVKLVSPPVPRFRLFVSCGFRVLRKRSSL